jgi:hypoxanthine-DNA glycosylase
MRVYSFAPVASRRARVLILGSMPGVASLAAAQYYAHPRNQFWGIITELCGREALPSYAQRLQMLRVHQLALWDVLHSCLRPGSLDAAIEHRSAQPNALLELIGRSPELSRICCNGGTAHSALQRHFGRALAELFPQIEIHRLPSTSPANASWSYARKLAAWRSALSPAFDT